MRLLSTAVADPLREDGRLSVNQLFTGVRTVDAHFAWLRQNLDENPQTPRYIITVRGEGYWFRAVGVAWPSAPCVGPVDNTPYTSLRVI